MFALKRFTFLTLKMQQQKVKEYISVLPERARKSKNYRYCDSWKSNNYVILMIFLHLVILLITVIIKLFFLQNTKCSWCLPIILFSNVAIAILGFSLLPPVKLSLLIFFSSFMISVLCLFSIAKLEERLLNGEKQRKVLNCYRNI